MITVKSERELDIMRRAGHIVKMALDRIEELIAPGITTSELSKEAERVIINANAIPSFKGVPSPYGELISRPRYARR